MFSKCERSIEELRKEAADRLTEYFRLDGLDDSPITPDFPAHWRFAKTYPNSCGPFKRGLAMHAFWKFEMDAFVMQAFDDKDLGQAPFEVAAVFAAGRFWAIVKWTCEITMEELPQEDLES